MNQAFRTGNVLPLEPTSNWYAIYTRSRFEKKINTTLRKYGYETYLPLIKEKRIWSDRLKTVEVPLLPGYVFIDLESGQHHEIYRFPGFVKFVSESGRPCKIRNKDILLLRKVVENNCPVFPLTDCKVGDWVEIIRGPFRGWEGNVVEAIGKSKILFHLSCINQSLCVEVNRMHIIKKCMRKKEA